MYMICMHGIRPKITVWFCEPGPSRIPTIFALCRCRKFNESVKIMVGSVPRFTISKILFSCTEMSVNFPILLIPIFTLAAWTCLSFSYQMYDMVCANRSKQFYFSYIKHQYWIEIFVITWIIDTEKFKISVFTKHCYKKV